LPFISGINAEHQDDTFRVAAILPGSPAEKVGIVPGDVVVSVSSNDNSAYSLNDIEGTTYKRGLTLQVMRDGKRMSFPIVTASLTELLKQTADANESTTVYSGSL
jgi:C-terminal processing protease CtpA/Prc